MMTVTSRCTGTGILRFGASTSGCRDGKTRKSQSPQRLQVFRRAGGCTLRLAAGTAVTRTQSMTVTLHLPVQQLPCVSGQATTSFISESTFTTVYCRPAARRRRRPPGRQACHCIRDFPSHCQCQCTRRSLAVDGCLGLRSPRLS